MIAVPAAMPVTVPVDEPIMAIPVAAEDQVPPPAASVNVMVPVTHTVLVPPIGPGPKFTVTIVEALQPEGAV